MKCQIFGYTRVLVMIAALAGSAVFAAEHADGGHGSHDMSPQGAAKDIKELPPLRIVSPLAGAQVGPNIKVEFETDADLASMTMSAKSIGVHLHVGIDDTSLMPMMADLARVKKNRYRYTFDLPAAPGQRVISVYWSDASHKTIESSVQKVSVVVVLKRGTVKP
ncbi:hypothetical protein [Rhodoferax sp.]|uniref:hypothetical protein n=1 Tax=Rhodoferax sp. TaxID=50421 RepID=UPI003BB4D94D